MELYPTKIFRGNLARMQVKQLESGEVRGSRWLKQPLLRLARNLRAFDAAHSSSWRDQRLLILCYHGIADGDENQWNGDLFLSRSTFSERMESLKRRHCAVLSLSEAIDGLYAGKLPKRAVTITFDDGFADFHGNALPILKKYGYPATVYLSTWYSEHFTLPVFPVTCSFLLWKARGQVRMGLDIPGVPSELDLRTTGGRESSALSIINFAAEKEYSGKAKDELLSRLAAALGEDFEVLRKQRTLNLMSPEEIHEVSRSGVAIEMHSRSHRIPNQRQRFERDLRRNADHIREWTGVAPSHFCYPSGLVAPHWVEWLREFPVKSAVTCTAAIASAGDDAMLLPRYVDGSRASALEFESWISGFAPIVARKAAMRMPAEGAAAASQLKACAANVTAPLAPPVSTPPSDRGPDWPMHSKESA
jgi:peptidoglycan/xylan/chitin deacetylase (PgdA/CDA1 family)